MEIISGDIFRDNIGAWLAATIVALMTVFSDKLLHAFNDKGEEDRKTMALAKELDRLRATAARWMVQTS